MSTDEALMTAEEFGRKPDPGHPEELVRGRVIDGVYPDPRHGYVCVNAGCLIHQWVEDRDLGHVMNLCGMITSRNPDSVRGPDISYYSYARLPRDADLRGYGPELPDLIIDVVSSFDRWREILVKVAEYLKAGVLVVILLDPETQLAYVYGDDEPRILQASDELVLPEVLEGFRVRVGQFFE